MAQTDRHTQILAKVQAQGGHGWYAHDIGEGQYVLVGDTIQSSNRGGHTTIGEEIAEEILADVVLHRDTDVFGICDANTGRTAVWVHTEWQVFESNHEDYRSYKRWRNAEHRLSQI